MADNLLDLRTIKGFQGASETPFTDNLLGVNTGKTITGQEFSDNPIIKPFQQFNKALGTGLLETGEKAFNLGMGAVNLPFAFAGDTAEGVYEMLPEDWQAKTSQLMYNSGGSMDPDEFGDQFYGHLVEGVFAFPTLSEFQPWFRANQGKKPPKEIVEAIVEKIGTQPNQFSQQLYLSYNKNINNPKQLVTNKVDAPESYLKEIADFYEGAKHQPNHPTIQLSYDSLINETLAQYQHMIDGGIIPKIYIGSKGKPEPYVSSGHMMNDVANNKSLKFLKTNLDDLPPDHPLAQPSGIILDGQELIMNDVFRVVHDFYGHTPNGFQFGPKGEYNAFRSHANMYSDASISALANETLFQNAWVNYNKSMRREDGTVPKPNDPDFIPQNERPFADQKVILFDESLLNKDPNFETVTTDAMIYADNVTGIDKKVAVGNEYKAISEQSEPFGLLESTRKTDLDQTRGIYERLDKRMEYDLQDIRAIDPDYKPNIVTLDPEGRVINARFVSGKKDPLANDVYSSAKINELDDIGLTDYEIKRLAMIIADEYGSGYKYFQANPTHRGFVDALIQEDGKGNMLGIRQRLGINNQIVKYKDGKPKVEMLSKDEIMDVLQHETGHLIGNMTSYKSVYAQYLKDNPKTNITNEMISMSKELRPKNWKDNSQSKYLNKPEELMADSIKMYLINPAKAKQIAPEFVKFLRKMLNDSSIKNIINLSKAPTNMIDDGLLSKYA